MGRRHEPQPAVGRAIRHFRAQRGLLQKDLAHAADVNETEMSNLERGVLNPAWGTVKRVARALGLEVSDVAALAERMERGDEPDADGGDEPADASPPHDRELR
jgi:DNA-binding XRE family transcriptional regulator